MLRVQAPEPERLGHAATAPARPLGADQAALGPRECHDGFAGPGEPLSEGRRTDGQDPGRLVTFHLEDLAEDVGEAVRPVEAGQHAESAADLHLLEEKSRLCCGRPRGGVGEALVEISAEALEGEPLLLETALPGRQQVVRRHAVGPGREGALPAKSREASDDSDQDLLGRVAGILGMPEHP